MSSTISAPYVHSSFCLLGENINITWSPDGNTIAVGNKEDLVTFIDTRTHKIKAEEQFNFEVNEISWNKQSNLFFLTNGQGCIHILRYSLHISELSFFLASVCNNPKKLKNL